MRILAFAVALAATPIHAAEGVPCEGAAATMRMMAMSMGSVTAYGRACAPDPTAAPCMTMGLAIAAAAETLQDSDGEKATDFHRWLSQECPGLPPVMN